MKSSIKHFIYQKYRRISCSFGNFRRRYLYLNDSEKYIKSLKGNHNGDKCFVIGTGPSLSIEDLEKIGARKCFSMSCNSIVLSFDDTNWRPDLYAIQDVQSFRLLKDKILKSNIPNIFCSDELFLRYSVPKQYHKYPLDPLNHLGKGQMDYNAVFSDDCSIVIYDGYTVVFSLIQIAVYMGFKEIFLLGVDCNYNSSKSHFKDYGLIDESNKTASNRQTIGYIVAKEYCDKVGVSIVNCTRGGNLEVFQRMTLEEALKKWK